MLRIQNDGFMVESPSLPHLTKQIGGLKEGSVILQGAHPTQTIGLETLFLCFPDIKLLLYLQLGSDSIA